ncbi:MAG: PDZ domain-containing protein, partial [Planctomycetales bacterium]|nr:PDZ domain-containing protein [Planctomycetales bacterium]
VDEVFSSDFWLGLRGGPVESAALRTHLQLAANTGIQVEEVLDDSPAAKAGLRKYDILLRVNDEPVHDMLVVKEAVTSSEGKPLKLQIIRLAKEMEISATPEPRPESFAAEDGLDAFEDAMELGNFDQMRRMVEQMQQQGGAMRMIGPGIAGNRIFLHHFGAKAPDGVSVSIQRQGNEPATITVRRGKESWTLSSDDKDELQKLPKDLRDYVGQLQQQNSSTPEEILEGRFPRFQEAQIEKLLPRWDGAMQEQLARQAEQTARKAVQQAQRAQQGAEQAQQRIMQRMQKLEKQLKEMQQRLDDSAKKLKSDDAA